MKVISLAELLNHAKTIHPSVLKIKNKFGSDLNRFVKGSVKVKKPLKDIYVKKVVGVDTISP